MLRKIARVNEIYELDVHVILHGIYLSCIELPPLKAAHRQDCGARLCILYAWSDVWRQNLNKWTGIHSFNLEGGVCKLKRKPFKTDL